LTKTIVVTSGKGGVGKTTTSASIATGLAQRGFKTVVIDFDVGLRNLDLIMGCERRVVYDLVNLVNQESSLHQTLIKDKRIDNLYILPASQTRDKDSLTIEGIARVMHKLRKSDFDYIICDSPAGIEKGAKMALYFADEAVIATNPEVSSVRDSDRILGILQSESKRAKMNEEPVREHLLITRYNPGRVKEGQMLSVDDIVELLSIPLLGIIPESASVLDSSNAGKPVILDEASEAGQAYSDAIGIFSFFRSRNEDQSAKVAKDRLQVLIAHERSDRDGPDYLPMLKQDILNVIKKYVSVGEEQVSVQLDSQENCDVLELNITLPEDIEPEAPAKRKQPAQKSVRNAGSLAPPGQKPSDSGKSSKSQSKVT